MGINLPSTSLIICSRNRPKLLADLVSSILEGDEVPTELIILDDSDTPHETLSNLKTDRCCEVRYLWTHSAGLSRANNDGIAAARYEILVFTQDDVLVAPTWFRSIVEALIGGGLRMVVTGAVLEGKAETSSGFAPSTIADERQAIYQGRIGKDVLYMQNMAMYRGTVDDIGLFDQRMGPGTPFPSAEDNDFGLRLLESGYQIMYVPWAVTYHRAWRSEEDFMRLCWNYGRGLGAYYAKHLTLRDRYMLWRMVSAVAGYVVRFPYRIFRRRRQAFADAVYLSGLLSGAGQWLLMQRNKRPW